MQYKEGSPEELPEMKFIRFVFLSYTICFADYKREYSQFSSYLVYYLCVIIFCYIFRESTFLNEIKNFIHLTIIDYSFRWVIEVLYCCCLLYTSDAADEL